MIINVLGERSSYLLQKHIMSFSLSLSFFTFAEQGQQLQRSKQYSRKVNQTIAPITNMNRNPPIMNAYRARKVKHQMKKEEMLERRAHTRNPHTAGSVRLSSQYRTFTCWRSSHWCYSWNAARTRLRQTRN